MPDLTQRHRPAAIGTSLKDDRLLLQRMHGCERISEPFRYHVEMVSEDANIPFEKLIGEGATIRLAHETQKEPRYFNGIVADFRQLEPEHGLNRYEATLVPWLWFLNKTSNCRIFQKIAVPEIVAEIFKMHGFEDFELRLSYSYPPIDYCVQYRETDFSFVSRLMEEVGIYYFFTHENGKHTLVLGDSRAARDPCPEFEKLRYIGAQASHPKPKDIQRWEPRKQVVSGAFHLKDFNFAEPKKRYESEFRRDKEHNLAHFEQYDHEGEFTEEGGSDPRGKVQLEDLAEIRLDAIQTEHLTAAGESECRGLCLGHTFTLSDCFRSDQDGQHFIVEIHHVIELGDYVSGSGSHSGEKLYKCSFLTIPDEAEFHPLRRIPKPRVAGPQTAIVTGRKGEEIDTDEFGRVKVQFHWDREGQADERSSCWVRVSQNWAGKKWGAFFLPRIGQEVIVDFLEGDPDRPIITGRVYNGDNMPPYELPAEKTKSTIKSNSSKDKEGHNELRFEDKAGEEQIYIHAEKDMDVRVKNDQRETTVMNRDIRVGSEEGGDLSVWVKNDENRHIEHDQFELIDNDSHLTVKGERAEKFEKSKKTFVQDDAVLNADNLIAETKTAISLKTAKFTLQGAQGVHIKGQNINLEASSISLKCGGSFVHIGPAGVDIKGPMVKINSGGSAKSADAPKALPEISVLEALEAVVATDSKAGGVGSGVARSVTRGGGVIAPHLVPELTPLGDESTNIGASPALSSNPIIAESSENTLCNGPYRICDVQGRTDLGKALIEITSPDYKGKPDKIHFRKANEEACGCSGAIYEFEGHAGRHPFSQKSLVPKSEPNREALSSLDQIRDRLNWKPRQEQVTLRCGKTDEVLKRYEIRIYDGTQVDKLEFDATNFFKANSAFKKFYDLIDAFGKIAGREFASKFKPDQILANGLRLDFKLLFVEFKTPKIKFSFEGKWKEFKSGHSTENRVYYNFEIFLKADPFFSVSLKVDLVHALTLIPYFAPVKPVYEKLKKHINSNDKGEFAGPPLYIGVEAGLKGQGGMKRDPDWQSQIQITAFGLGSIGVEVSIGGVIEAKGDLGGGIEGGFDLLGQGDHLDLMSVGPRLGKMEGRIEVSLDTGWFGKWGKAKKIVLKEEGQSFLGQDFTKRIF